MLNLHLTAVFFTTGFLLFLAFFSFQFILSLVALF